MTFAHRLKLIFVGPDKENDKSDQEPSSTKDILKKDVPIANQLHEANVPNSKTRGGKATVSDAYTNNRSKSKLKVDPLAKPAKENKKKVTTTTKAKSTTKPKKVTITSSTTNLNLVDTTSQFRKPTALSVEDEQILNSAVDPKIFFEQYDKIINDFTNTNKNAAVETMKAQRDGRTKEFLARSVNYATKQAESLKTKKAKQDYVNKWIAVIRKYNSVLTVDARASLSVLKKEVTAKIKES